MLTSLRYQGIVQGVGFRPRVWHIAKQLNLSGDVSNDGNGVIVRLWATGSEVKAFRQAFESSPPPLAKITQVYEKRSASIQPLTTGFQILASTATRPMTGIAPDAATCGDCIDEINQPQNRRYRYPFTNCTNCGPRLSIINAIPYDRANTSMQMFNLCPGCAQEYSDPANRRYHAQPNACPFCGPKIWLVGEQPKANEDHISATARLLKEGKIVAIKGIGGFHLACDATNANAVQLLRKRKRRKIKPFALMATDLNMIGDYCKLTESEAKQLQSSAAPIVLLPRRSLASDLVKTIAPGTNLIGFMLPYSPLHHLLLAECQRPLVMTSGNMSHQPQCIENQQAQIKLAEIADALLLHDRKIINRVDDSVIRFIADKPRLIRRARGFAPAPLQLHPSFDKQLPVLALGGELKNTICLLQHGRAIISQHLGDLQDAETSDEFERTVQLYQQLYQFKPKAVAIDRHPDYRSSRFGIQLSKNQGSALYKIQHHHAHVAAVLAENQWPLKGKKVLGICFDGLGFSDDGTIWGGEFMLVDYQDYQRVASLSPVVMPGAHQAIIQPWRNFWAQLATHFEWDKLIKQWGQLAVIKKLMDKPIASLKTMQEKQINSPLTSSSGRLFDAVAAALDLNFETIDYEGQAAIALENLAESSSVTNAYPFDLVNKSDLWQLSAKPMWQALLQDLGENKNKADIARSFHLGLATAIYQLVMKLKEEYDFDTVALSGGVMQNKLLFERLTSKLKAQFKLIHHNQVPSNDGGLSLGQAVIAAALHK
jgi:hydrogenase maturation protein HypF